MVVLASVSGPIAMLNALNGIAALLLLNNAEQIDLPPLIVPLLKLESPV